MSASTASPRWHSPPLVLQILALLLAGLVVAQVVTLLLTMILPPEPSPQHSIAEVAATLQGAAAGENRTDLLQRSIQSGPPDLTGAGWLISTKSERELSQRLGVDPADVRLAFYTPLPFAGTSTPHVKLGYTADDGPVPGLGAATGFRHASFLILAQAQGPAPPMDRLPRNAMPPNHDTLPPVQMPGRGPPGGMRPDGHGPIPTGTEQIAPARGSEPLFRVDPTPVQRGGGGIWIGGDNGETIPSILRAPPTQQIPSPSRTTPTQTAPSQTIPFQNVPGSAAEPTEPSALQPFQNGIGMQPGGPMRPGTIMQQLLPDRATISPDVRIAPSSRSGPIETPRVTVEPGRATPAITPHAPAAPEIRQAQSPGESDLPRAVPVSPIADIRAPSTLTVSRDPVVPLVGRAGGLFGLAPSPFVEGDFVAALKLADGQWAIVKPAAEPFPNAWQRRVLLWFAIAFAVVAPLGWLFARRLVKPLIGFADAAERLGRDPSIATLDLDGPAEIGRAARALNIMQSRLKSFVNDRTAMIGAISHDLRTPLTRLRFRIEDVDDETVRDGMIEEVEQMEQMITSVLAFIRDASSQGVRERTDLRSIIEDVVEDATMVGGNVVLEQGEAVPVEVDVMGMRRLLTNLLENAVKYGDRARVRLTVDVDEAVAEVSDDGPGVPEEDLERAFEPFYRAANAISSDKRGTGLGLTVCRSIARAHGGDVRLSRSQDGFVAQLRVPLSYTEQVRAA